ncbi:hypothetical protein JCM1841_002458 [Sporobolomyces salmonicolor]
MAPLVVPNADSGGAGVAFKEGDSDLSYLDRAAILRPQALRLHLSVSAEHNGEETTTVWVTKVKMVTATATREESTSGAASSPTDEAYSSGTKEKTTSSTAPPAASGGQHSFDAAPEASTSSPSRSSILLPSSSSSSYLAAILGSTLGALALLSTTKQPVRTRSGSPREVLEDDAGLAAVPPRGRGAGAARRSEPVSSTAEEGDETDLLGTAARGHTPPELEAGAAAPAASGHDDPASIPIVGLGTATPTPPSSSPVVDHDAESGALFDGRKRNPFSKEGDLSTDEEEYDARRTVVGVGERRPSGMAERKRLGGEGSQPLLWGEEA